MRRILYFLLALALVALAIYFLLFAKKEPFEYVPVKTAYTTLAADATMIPEEQAYIDASNTANVGIAASGGGSRALTATLGSYRGLTHLGLMDRVRYISSVSGGAWASTAYTYLPANISDEDFLGTAFEDPAQLYWGAADDSNPANVNYLSENNLGQVPGRLGIPQLIETILEEKMKYSYPLNQAWIRAIGKLVLEPYGLSEIHKNKEDKDTYGKPTKFYSLNETSAQKIIDLNPDLSLSDFRLVQRKRPFLIVNTSLFETKEQGVALIPVESTGLGVGIRSAFLGKGIDGGDIGGGFVAPQGFGSKGQKVVREGVVEVEEAARFSLADIAGLSSATFAEGIESTNPKLDGLLPKYNYWPITNMEAPKNQSKEYWFADGGNIENTGINALLARKVPTIIALTHGSEDLVKKDNGVIFVDYQICSLFGYMPLGDSTNYVLYKDAGKIVGDNIGFQNNQVFASEAFKDVQEGLWEAKQAGGPVAYVQKLTTIENHYFDVEAGHEVTIVWFYLNKNEAWYNKLSPELREKMEKEPKKFKEFPRYATKKQLHLEAPEVNLMSQMTTWNLIQDELIIPSAGVTSKVLMEQLLGEKEQ